MYERSHVSVKVEPRSTSRLRSTLYILPLFIYVIKIYVRGHARKITRQRKSTIRLVVQ